MVYLQLNQAELSAFVLDCRGHSQLGQNPQYRHLVCQDQSGLASGRGCIVSVMMREREALTSLLVPVNIVICLHS